MKIILTTNVKKLGKVGDIVSVKPGYARNFLFPNKIAIQATKENKEIFEKQKEQLNKANKEKIKIAEQLMTKVPDSIKIYREASEQGALFGSVTSRDVVNEFNNSKKLNLKAKDFIIKQVIKNLGEYTGTLVLHPEVTKNIQIQVQTIEK